MDTKPRPCLGVINPTSLCDFVFIYHTKLSDAVNVMGQNSVSPNPVLHSNPNLIPSLNPKFKSGRVACMYTSIDVNILHSSLEPSPNSMNSDSFVSPSKAPSNRSRMVL